ncbi:unnamed protein product, partial [Durusdinium trenchii]
MADCESLKETNHGTSTSYGTLMGVEYQRGTGAVRLIYCTIIAVVLSGIRIVCDLAVGFAIAHHSAWVFICVSFIDLLLAAAAATAAYFALTVRRRGIIVFAITSFLETAIFSLAYFVVVTLDVVHAWERCESQKLACDPRSSELSDHG